MAQSILVVSRSAELVSELRTALNASSMSALTLDRAPSAALAVRILGGSQKEIDAVVVDLEERGEALALLAELEAAQSAMPVYAASLGGGSASEEAAERLGGRVFRRAEDLPLLLAGVSAVPRRGGARLVLFAPAQEGAGASTAALHVAACLAREHALRTLFVELDYHSDSVACRLRLASAKSLTDLEPGQDWREAVTPWNALHVLAAPTSARILRRRGLPDLPGVLADTGESYDFVVGDLPCNTAVAPPEILTSAERIYVVATAEVTSLHLARRRILELGARGARPGAVHLIINRDRRGAVDSEVVKRVTGLGPACRLPNDYSAASEAETEGRTVASGSTLGLAFTGLAAEISGKAAPIADGRDKGWSRLLAWR